MEKTVSNYCPLCGRETRAHSRITVEDIGADGTLTSTGFSAVICRDCAFATVIRAKADAVEHLAALQTPSMR